VSDADNRSGSVKTPSNDELDYLLSSGRLGGSQHQGILDAALQSVRVRESRFGASRGRGAMRIAAPAIAMAAAFAAFLSWPHTRAGLDHFQSKGEAPAVSIDAACLHASLGACPRGSILAFSVRGAQSGMLVTAYLQPLDAGSRVWLLSNEPVSAETTENPGLLPRGSQIPEDQVAGDYHLQVVVTRRPLSHENALSPDPTDVVASTRFEVEVVQ
jgi:hypothetical protein